ncbi:hypothetical protein TTRE_0000196001 [Trichuris trichiura]|uniref:Uncharacterized protein n=1 Tax=Trichuris trichiura TaxID=36087 RepID=A0A077Z4S8_TRITR|nr:hypothetical protein TTRE_0000196001 [Trichuris trichiura]
MSNISRCNGVPAGSVSVVTAEETTDEERWVPTLSTIEEEPEEESGLTNADSGGEEAEKASLVDTAKMSPPEGNNAEDLSFRTVLETGDDFDSESDESAQGRKIDSAECVDVHTVTWLCLFLSVAAGILLYCYTYEIHEHLQEIFEAMNLH